MSRINTVGELKKFINELDDRMPLVIESSNFELGGAFVKGIYPRVSKFNVERKNFRDAFDGEIYDTTVYIQNDDGEKCLRFLSI